jgi:predicted TIM-barrel fold metal-dependent hydrolase
MGSIDADAHVIESPLTWSYLSEAESRYMPMVVTQSWGDERPDDDGRRASEYWLMDNRLHARDRNIGTDTSVESREMRDVQARLAHMDELGIDVQVLYPTVFLRPAVRTAAAELALTRAYNRWLANIWEHAPTRLHWVVLPPLASAPEVIAEELAWAKDHGAVGIFMRGLEWDRNVADPFFFPMYEAAEKLDLPICFHSGNNSILHHDFFLDDTTFTKFKLAVVGAFHSLLEKDVPGRFPGLRWGFVEVSAQWVPYVCHDLRYRFRRLGRRLPDKPLAANRMYVACEVTDDIPYILQYAGEDNIVVGTDYGHHDPSTEINAFTLIRKREDLSAEIITKITDTNARALYGL